MADNVYDAIVIGSVGNWDGLDVLPDGEFLPPMEMNVVEKNLVACML